MENNKRRRQRAEMERVKEEQRLAGQRQRERERLARATAGRDVHIDTSAELNDDDDDGLIGELNQGGTLLDEDSPTAFNTPTAVSSAAARGVASRVRERERGGSKRRSRGSSGSVQDDMQREGRVWRRRRVDSPEHEPRGGDAKRRRSSSTTTTAAPRGSLSVDVDRNEPLGHVRALDRAAKRSSNGGRGAGVSLRTVKELSARMQHRKRPMSPFAPKGAEPRETRRRSGRRSASTTTTSSSTTSASSSSSSSSNSTRRPGRAVASSSSSSSLRRTQAALQLESLSMPGPLASPLADLPTPTVPKFPAAGGNGVGKGGAKRGGAGASSGMGVGKGGTKRDGAGKTTASKTTASKTTASKTTPAGKTTTAGKTTAGKTTAGKTTAGMDSDVSDMSDVDESYWSDGDTFRFDLDGPGVLDGTDSDPAGNSDYSLPGIFSAASNRTELAIEDAVEHTRESLRGASREAIRCKHEADGMDKSRPYERANLYLSAALNFLEVAMARSTHANFRLQDLLNITTLFNTAALKFKQASDEEREALAKQCEAVTYMKYGALRRTRVRGKLKAMLDVVGRQRSRQGEPSTPSGEFGFLSGNTSGHSGTVNLKELSDVCKETMLCFNAFDALSTRRAELIVSMHHRLRDGRQYHALAADGGPWLLADFFSSNPRRLITYVRNTIQILDEERLATGGRSAE